MSKINFTLCSIKGWPGTHVIRYNDPLRASLCGRWDSPGWQAGEPLKPICKECARKIDQNDLAWLKVKKIVADYPEITIDRFKAAAMHNDFLSSLEHQLDTLAEWCIQVIASGQELTKEFLELERSIEIEKAEHSNDVRI